MHIKFNTKDFESALSRLTKVVSSPDYVQFNCSSKASLETENEGVSVSVDLPCELLSPGNFALEFAYLKKVFKGRKDIEMKSAPKGNRILFKAGSSKDYSGEVVTVPEHSIKFARTGGITFTDEQVAFIKASIPNISIEDTIFKKPLSMTVLFTESFGICFINSDTHAAVTKIKGKFPDLSLTLPSKNFMSLIALSEGKPLKIELTESSVLAEGETFRAILPLESQEEAKTQRLLDLLKTTHAIDVSAKVDVKELSTVLDSVAALTTNNSVKMELDKSNLYASVSSVKGSARSKVKTTYCEGDVSFHIDQSLLANLLKNAKSGVCAMRVTEKVALLSSKVDSMHVHYLCALRSS